MLKLSFHSVFVFPVNRLYLLTYFYMVVLGLNPYNKYGIKFYNFSKLKFIKKLWFYQKLYLKAKKQKQGIEFFIYYYSYTIQTGIDKIYFQQTDYGKTIQNIF